MGIITFVNEFSHPKISTKFDNVSTVKLKFGGGSYVTVGKCAQKET